MLLLLQEAPNSTFKTFDLVKSGVVKTGSKGNEM
jgi:hypothetical protein